jgi:geranylgeranyl diphosphate synthase type II
MKLGFMPVASSFNISMYTFNEIQSVITAEVEKKIEHLSGSDLKNLYQPIGYALSMGGKRLRPAMVLLAYNMFRENIREALPVAMAVEVFHNFTLLHDDIMDKAEMRRNNPSVYKKYNENIAILSGDAMSIMAYISLLESTSVQLPALIRLFSQTALEVCEGQQYDMDFETSLEVSIADYLEMIRLKTAVLLAASLKLGALAANAPAKAADQLYNLGLNLGIAFQLQDDLLDVFADQDKFGKKIGGDIVSNKKTFLLLKALDVSDPESKAVILDWIQRKNFDAEEKVIAVSAVYDKLNIKKITEDHIEKYFQSAINILDDIELPEEKKAELNHLANQILNRDH